MDELSDGLLWVERERRRGKLAHRKPTDDGPSKAPRTELSCSRNVSCNHGLEQLQIHGERSANGLIHPRISALAVNNLTLLKSSTGTRRKTAPASSNPWLELGCHSISNLEI
jgi:hypothetical protein